MRLTPREIERLLLFQAAELARRRRGRGLLLNQAEATAVIADEVCEAARDGLGYEAVSARGYAVLGPADVLDGVAALVPRIEVEALFGDGMRLTPGGCLRPASIHFGGDAGHVLTRRISIHFSVPNLERECVKAPLRFLLARSS